MIAYQPTKLLHVGFWKDSSIESDKLETVFSQATSWLRYMTNGWILYTNEDAMVWAQRIRAVPGMESANIFVSEFSGEYAGYLPDWGWKWLADNTPTGGRKPAGF